MSLRAHSVAAAPPCVELRAEPSQHFLTNGLSSLRTSQNNRRPSHGCKFPRPQQIFDARRNIIDTVDFDRRAVTEQKIAVCRFLTRDWIHDQQRV